MTAHDPKHQSKMVLSYQWSSFFAELEKEFKDKTIYLYPEAHLEHASENADPVTLISLQFTHKLGKNTLMVETAVADDSSTISQQVNLVWAIQDENDKLLSLEIIDKHDEKLVIELG